MQPNRHLLYKTETIIFSRMEGGMDHGRDHQYSEGYASLFERGPLHPRSIFLEKIRINSPTSLTRLFRELFI